MRTEWSSNILKILYWSIEQSQVYCRMKRSRRRSSRGSRSRSSSRKKPKKMSRRRNEE
jgi:hypothetical protein